MGVISAVLLAAGESTRLGEPKALLAWRGQTLLQHQIESLASAGINDIVVVLGHQAERLEATIAATPPVKIVRNRAYKDGKVTSIKAGLRAIDPACEAILVLGVDQPRSANTLERLLRAHREGHTEVTMPVFGTRGGHPPVFAAALLPELLAITEEQAGIRAVINQPGRRINRVEMSAEVTLDINKPGDYAAALRQLEEEKL